MRVLCVNYVISAFGGVEFAAMNLASGLIARGHDVHFLAAEGQRAPLAPGSAASDHAAQDSYSPLRRHYRDFPRIYPVGEKRGFIQKLIWHTQDIAHPANEKLFAEVLGQIRPDIIILHNITAVGMNIWRTIRSSGIPCIQVVHDLSLICLNMARFRGGRQCTRLCTACRVQKSFRFSMIANAPNFAFVSPSHATLEEIERFADLSAWRREVIANPNTFMVKVRNVPAGPPRLLYIGRLEPSKGVEMMLRAAQAARKEADFELDILGSGVLEAELRRQYAQCGWIRFHGSVDQDAVADFMAKALALLVPSLWLETVPGVAVHALFAGLPVLGSRIGGIPEHVADGRTGRLLPPGDEDAWRAEIVHVVKHPQDVAAWSNACHNEARRFDPALALDKYEGLMRDLVGASTNTRAKATAGP